MNVSFNIALCSPCGLATAIGHITVIYQAAVLAPLRFPRSFIAHRLLSALLLAPRLSLELMPCAAHSCLWCDFDADSSRLPPPFHSLCRSSLCC